LIYNSINSNNEDSRINSDDRTMSSCPDQQEAQETEQTRTS